MCQRMAELTAKADIITPNLTEACILDNIPYNSAMTCEDAGKLAQALSGAGPARVVITGIEHAGQVSNVCFERGQAPFTVQTAKLGGQRSGHGRRVLRHPYRRRRQRRAAGQIGGEGVALRGRMRAARHRA